MIVLPLLYVHTFQKMNRGIVRLDVSTKGFSFSPSSLKRGGGGPVQEVLVRSDGRVIDGVTRVCWFQLDLGWVHEKRRISPG